MVIYPGELPELGHGPSAGRRRRVPTASGYAGSGRRRVAHNNTPLARSLARLYEEKTGQPFPGGVENAYIQRSYAGYWQRASGAMSWYLEPIHREDEDGKTLMPRTFGSQWGVRDALKDIEERIVWDW